MSGTEIFWPMMIHVGLVFAIYALMLLRRRAAVRAGNARISDFRENLKEPAESLFVKNNLANQFELPVLFHVVCLSLFVTGGVGALAVLAAWFFALSRIVHAFIHITSNRIRWRQPAFATGFMALGLLWILLAVHLFGTL